MARTGVEAKPTWAAVPRLVREAVERALGAPVVRGSRVWGGFGPTPTFRLLCANGERAFFKGVCPDSSEFMTQALQREVRVYTEIPHLAGRWAPAVLGQVECDGWRGLLLEDLGDKSVLPWTVGRARAVMHSYAQFHRSTEDAVKPTWLPSAAEIATRPGRSWFWDTAITPPERVARLAGSASAEARDWFTSAHGALASASAAFASDKWRTCFLHGDTRSDNLKWVDGRLVLLDWPHVSAGPPEYDVVMFVQTITLESGVEPERLVDWYADVNPVDHGALSAALAAIAGFFTNECWQPEVPGLPRLRRFQRAQLAVVLPWASRQLGLAEPCWTAAIA